MKYITLIDDEEGVLRGHNAGKLSGSWISLGSRLNMSHDSANNGEKSSSGIFFSSWSSFYNFRRFDKCSTMSKPSAAVALL